MFFDESRSVTKNMNERGGGILDIELINRADLEPNYYQLQAKFETCDAMGANFINSLLEKFSKILQRELEKSALSENDKKIIIIMCILSNYTPECIVRCEVNCDVKDLSDDPKINNEEFSKKFQQAIHVANIEPYRATTHNKGIFNGIDAVVIATGNDFRAVEACGHTYASRSGQYKSLTSVEIKNGRFKFWIDLPISVGTVGGLLTFATWMREFDRGIPRLHKKSWDKFTKHDLRVLRGGYVAVTRALKRKTIYDLRNKLCEIFDRLDCKEP